MTMPNRKHGDRKPHKENLLVLEQLLLAPPQAQNQEKEDKFLHDLISAYTAEYNVLRAELLQVQTAQGQIVLAAIVALGAAAPVISSLLENRIWHSLLILPLLFSTMALIHSGYIGTSFIISSYINNELRPTINSILRQNISIQIKEAFTWEKYSHKTTIYWDPLGLRKPAEATLFTLPQFGAIFLFIYLGLTGRFILSLLDWLLVIFSILQVLFVILVLLGVNSAGVRRIGK